MAILSTGFGKGMIFIVFAMAKEDNIFIKNLYDHNFASKKYYRRPNFRNVVVELYSNGAYDRNSATTLLLRYFQRYLARACARGSSL